MEPVVDDRPTTAPGAGGNPPIAAGTLLAGRYRLGPRVGAGGMATIFRGHDETLDRGIAVKVLHAHLADDPSLLERFKAEARAAAGLLHPHIVNVFDQGVADLPFIVMEFVDGPSLRDVLSQRGRLPPREALAVMEPVCAALARAHEMGLIHRDVKPENVLVSSVDGTVKVADFGIARALASANLTETGMLLGSVHYLPPELVRGGEASPASDQYAVGVMLFELLTGRKPLPAETPTAVAMRHAREPIPPPSSFVSDVSPEVDAVVARATEKDPAQRYPDLATFGAALRQAIPSGPQSVAVAQASESNGTLVIPREALETSQLDAASAPRSRRSRAGTAGLMDRVRDRTRRARSAAAEVATPTVTRRLVAVLGVVAALLLAGLGAFLLYDRLLVPVQTVPAVSELAQDDAIALLQARGLEVRLEDTSSRTIPEGMVVSSDPEAGAQMRQGETVTLAISSGPAVVEMPDVLQRTEQEALTQLGAPQLGFAVRVDREFSDTVPAGIVQAQVPPPGEDAREGQEVVINVSQGVEQIAVPDVVGRSRQEAEQILTAARLGVTVREEFRDDQPTPNVVVEQAVAPGATVDKNTAIEIVVSRGAPTVDLPDVRGRSIEEGVAIVQGVGLDVQVVQVPVPRFGPFLRGEPGRVEEQVPGPGPVPRDTQVALYTYIDNQDGDQSNGDQSNDDQRNDDQRNDDGNDRRRNDDDD